MREDAKGPYLDPYAHPLTYNAVRTQYVWEAGAHDEDLVRGALDRLTARHGRYLLAVEVGCGDGRLSGPLALAACRVVCTDPSSEQLAGCRAQHRNSRRHTFRQLAADQVARDEVLAAADLLAAFWSLTYPVQAYFGLAQLPDGSLRQVVGSDIALASARAFLRALMPGDRSRDYLLLLHDPQSVEQRWVTDAWESLVDFPFGRDLPLELIFERLANLEATGARVEVRKVRGHVACRDEEALELNFLHYHLRSLHTAVPAGLKEDLRRAMAPFKAGGGYRVPAGVLVATASVRAAGGA